MNINEEKSIAQTEPTTSYLFKNSSVHKGATYYLGSGIAKRDRVKPSKKEKIKAKSKRKQVKKSRKKNR